MFLIKALKQVKTKSLLSILLISLLVIVNIISKPQPAIAANGITKIGQIGGYEYPVIFDPSSVTIDVDSSNNVYILETGTSKVLVFNSQGNIVKIWGENGSTAGKIDQASDLVVAGGFVYIADTSNNRISKFNTAGEFVSAFGKGVLDGSNALQSCTTTCQTGLTGTGGGELNEPRSLAIDSSGNIIVNDHSNYRIQKFDSSGNFISTWGWGVDDGSSEYQICTTTCQAGIPGTGGGQINNIYKMVTDSSNNLYIADSSSYRIQKFDSSGNFISTWGWGVDDGSSEYQICTTTCQAGTSDPGGHLVFPRDLIINASGKLMVSNANRKIDTFTTAGVFESEITTDTTISVYNSIAYDGTDIYAGGESPQNFMQAAKFDSSGNMLEKYGGTSDKAGKLSLPTSGSEAKNRNSLVSDAENNRIQIFDNTGAFKFTFGWGVGDGSSEFQKCTADCQAGVSGNGEGQFSFPGVVVSDSDNKIYVADTNNNRIQVFSAEGDFLSKFGESGSGDGQFANPYSLVVLQNGNIAVADSGNARIQVFSAEGDFLSKFGESGSGDGQFSEATYIAADTNGNVYVTDKQTHLVQVFSSSGQFIKKVDFTSIGIPFSIAIDANNNIYVTLISGDGSGSIKKFNTDFQQTDSYSYDFDANDLPFFFGIVSVGIDGRLLVADAYNNRIRILCDNAVSSSGCVLGASTTNQDEQLSGTLAETGIKAVSASLTFGFLIAMSTYIYLDYRRHKLPLEIIEPKNSYSLMHHIKVVTIPLMKYRLTLSFSRVKSTGSSITRY